MEKTKKILMAVGRSGGHIYPAIAVAESLEDLSPSIEIHFIHAGSMVGKQILSNFKYPVHDIPLGALATGQSFFIKIKTLFQLPFVFFKVFFLIRKRGFHSVFGTGGSITGPVLLAGRLNGCNTSIWEGNSVSGIANKYLSFFVHRVFTVFSETTGMPKKKQILCSYPLRKSIKKQIEFKKPETGSDLFKILILGGSQGSLFLNKVLVESVKETEWRKDIFIYHQTGERFFTEIQDIYKNLNGVESFGFALDIYKYYQEADVVFSRAGSGAIFEVSAFKKPLVLIPLSYSAGGHQLKNAVNLFSKSLVELIKEDDFNTESFKDMVVSLRKNKDKRTNLALAISNYYKKDGSETIAQWMISNL